MQLLHSILSHWAVVSVVLVVVINDLRNAITNYPKIETGLTILGDILSIHTPSDSPGTLKLPFTRSEPPVGRLEQPKPTSLPPAALFIPFLFVISSCAPGILGAYQTLTNVAKTAEATAKAFELYDHDAQLALVRADKLSGKDPTAIETDLTSYRIKRGTVVKAFADVDASIQVGYTLLPLVSQGVKKSTDVQAWLTSLLLLAEKVYAAVHTFEVSP